MKGFAHANSGDLEEPSQIVGNSPPIHPAGLFFQVEIESKHELDADSTFAYPLTKAIGFMWEAAASK